MPLSASLVGLIKFTLAIFAAMFRMFLEPAIRQQLGEFFSLVLRKRFKWMILRFS